MLDAVDRDALGEPLPLSLLVLLVLLLIGVNGFFVASQYAMLKVKMNRIALISVEVDDRVELTKGIMSRVDRYLSICQLGITIASLGIGWIGAGITTQWLEAWFISLGIMSSDATRVTAFLLVFGFITMLHLIIGELVPKAIASALAERTVLTTARPLYVMYAVLSPCIRLVDSLTNFMLKMVGMRLVREQESANTEEDLRNLLKESHQRGYIDQTELTLVDNIFDFTETTAREIMIPRTEMICLRAGLSLQANKTIAIQYMRTRYPVCENDKDNIVGFVHIKDLLKHSMQSADDLSILMRPITTVPESISISTLLKLMQKKRTQIAILIDEYGGTSGLVTLEDIMEEIVGDIQDEFDPDVTSIVKRDDGAYSVSGLMLIEEINSFFGTSIETDEYDTIGGWMYARMHFPPQYNEPIYMENGFEFQIEEMQHLRISRIRITYRREIVQPERRIVEKKGLNGERKFPY
ncbi:hemolysin family protein [Paenibacillus sp. L3-i20]|uniref:hemolysin family protein n=1 Tax=Paenibacillus sp. L3-i20 TaxID=2905833 RepID=UPI0020C054A3|nr:hemolysin family protein [Paenibacillus sp. L3-i20]